MCFPGLLRQLGSPLGSGLGAVTTIRLPLGSQPVFVNTTQSHCGIRRELRYEFGEHLSLDL